MSSPTDWQRVLDSGIRVPNDRPLGDLTADLVAMLGDSDPRVRDGIAFPTLATWISDGVFDDLLSGLGDGMCSGLTIGLGEDGTDSVFRRSFSALTLAECFERDNYANVISNETFLTWADQIAGWITREKDLRGFIPGKGYAHAVAHAGDALATIAGSSKVGKLELVVLLDVIADRLLAPTDYFFVCAEEDRLARAALHILRRDLVPLDVVEPWVRRVAGGALPKGSPSRNPFLVAGNAQRFLRALHMQLALGPDKPSVRGDLLLVLIDELRRTNASFV